MVANHPAERENSHGCELGSSQSIAARDPAGSYAPAAAPYSPRLSASFSTFSNTSDGLSVAREY
jgi:hypothetical protein